MAESSLMRSLVLSSLKGSFFGGLLGDVLGRPFEGSKPTPRAEVRSFFSTLVPQGIKYRYSDDTVMTMDLVKSLIHDPSFNPKDMATNFTNSCIFSFTERFYGGSVRNVFYKWKDSNFTDIWSPAKEQFSGSGSFGNGAAMRVSPVGFVGGGGDLQAIAKLAVETSQLTHTHAEGVGGAVFQAVAVRNVLKTRIELSSKTLKEEAEVKDVRKVIVDGVEGDLRSLVTSEQSSPFVMLEKYVERLKDIREMLEREEEVGVTEICSKLGHGVAAVESVPTAFYVFLRGFSPIGDFEGACQFERTLGLAISLGGDADTIASMAGSLAGAYVGVDNIPAHLRVNAEGVDEILSLADQYFNRVVVLGLESHL